MHIDTVVMEQGHKHTSTSFPVANFVWKISYQSIDELQNSIANWKFMHSKGNRLHLNNVDKFSA